MPDLMTSVNNMSKEIVFTFGRWDAISFYEAENEMISTRLLTVLIICVIFIVSTALVFIIDATAKYEMYLDN